MEFFDSSKSIIENIYLLSGPILAILGITGIIQLILTKRVIITNSKREAANLAASQIEIYNNQIIPRMDELFFCKEKNKLKKVKIEVGDFNTGYLKEKLGSEKIASLIEERIIIGIPFLRVMNSLEAFSTYFIKGVADEEIAYSAVGRTFCNSIEDMFFDIASCRRKDDNSFQNSIALYKLWSNRISKEKLMKEKIELMEKMDKINDEKINPIGTK